MHPHDFGFTCPSAAPAGRIDFIFSSPQLAQRLETCDPVIDGDGVSGNAASDHLAVAATFSTTLKENSSYGVESAYALPTP